MKTEYSAIRRRREAENAVIEKYSKERSVAGRRPYMVCRAAMALTRSLDVTKGYDMTFQDDECFSEYLKELYALCDFLVKAEKEEESA